MQADDVLAPRRQAEIAQVIAALEKFNPTKIGRYADYLAGKYELKRNEIDQIGFRLAKELGHKTVYPVDVDGEFLFQHIVNYAKASGRSKELGALMSEVGNMVKAQNAYLASHTDLLLSVFEFGNDASCGSWHGRPVLALWRRAPARSSAERFRGWRGSAPKPHGCPMTLNT